MKKNVLALSIATMIGGLGFSGAAMAAPATFDVNESGAGVIQIVPYFTAQDGNATVLHVVNTDQNDGKIVKVRFRGASNSDDLLDFQVFLSPGDVWTGLASADADGLLQLVTNDSSCTLPQEVRTSVTKAQLDRLANRLWDTPAKKNAQTREGYIEILEMATVPKHSAPAATATSAQKVYTALKHVDKDGVMTAPCTLADLSALDSITDGKTFADSSVLAAPTGSLTASWYIMNVAKSTTFSGSATALALKGATAPVPVYAPQKAQTNSSTLVTADPLIASGIIEKQDFDVPDLSTPLLTGAPVVSDLADASTQAANLSAALNRATVGNQFYQDAGLSAATDWVFSMPTRRYLVAANYDAEKYIKGSTPATGGILEGVTAAGASAGAAGNTANYIIRNAMATATAQDGTRGNKFNVDGNITVDAEGKICVQAKGQIFFDRDENSVKDGHVVSPSIAKKLNLCGEVHVATFGAASPVGASLAQTSITTGFGAGWGIVDFGAVGATGTAVNGNGVPVLGSAFTAASNPNAGTGMVGNYGITWPHFYTSK